MGSIFTVITHVMPYLASLGVERSTAGMVAMLLPSLTARIPFGWLADIFNKKYVSNGYYYTYEDTWSNPNEIMTIEGAGYYPQATTNFLIGITLQFY